MARLRGERARAEVDIGACGRRGEAKETPIGYVPTRTGLTLDGLKISPEALDELVSRECRGLGERPGG